MKNLFLYIAAVLFTTTSMAQVESKKNTTNAEVEEKANHNTTRSNRKQGGIVNFDINKPEDQAGIFERRKCIKAGGTFYENPNGTKFCMPARSTADKSKAVPTEEIEGGIFERRKCLKAGGVWMTNSNGSMCLKKLDSSARKL
ncbi:hypothetical protein [Winogradskyella sp. PE311]|uniref:hypothetical protein n=1 Tax=Winogradskyella sp. PE311 TaxID=3366943 RepID=UPI003980AD2B